MAYFSQHSALLSSQRYCFKHVPMLVCTLFSGGNWEGEQGEVWIFIQALSLVYTVDKCPNFFSLSFALFP